MTSRAEAEDVARNQSASAWHRENSVLVEDNVMRFRRCIEVLYPARWTYKQESRWYVVVSPAVTCIGDYVSTVYLACRWPTELFHSSTLAWTTIYSYWEILRSQLDDFRVATLEYRFVCTFLVPTAPAWPFCTTLPVLFVRPRYNLYKRTDRISRTTAFVMLQLSNRVSNARILPD